MEAFEGRRGDRCSTEVAEIENGFQPWKHRSTTVEMEETAVDVWFRKHVGRQDTLHAKIEWLRDKLHKHISYRYRIALCIEPERNEALVESAGITVKEQSVLAAWDTVTQPDTAPARPSSAATPVEAKQEAKQQPKEAEDANKPMSLAGPDVHDEINAWAEGRLRSIVGFHSEGARRVVNDLVQIERLLCYNEMTREVLKQWVQGDGEFVVDCGLAFVLGKSRERPVPSCKVPTALQRVGPLSLSVCVCVCVVMLHLLARMFGQSPAGVPYHRYPKTGLQINS